MWREDRESAQQCWCTVGDHGVGLFLLHPLCHLFNILIAIVVLSWPDLGYDG